MRILIVDKTAGLETSHERHKAIAEQPGVDLHVLGPRRWIENGREIVWRPPENSPYAAHAGAMFFKDYYARAGYGAGLIRALAASQPDVIQLLEEPWSISALQTVIAAAVYAPTARLLFYTWENIYRPWTYPSRASRLYAMIDKILHNRSTAAVCATQGAKNVLLQKGYSKPILTASYGIPSFFFDETTQDSVPNRPFTIGYVGRILWMKGVDLLINAAAAIPDLHLIIAGSGEDQEKLQERCRELGIAGRVQ
ncbi:MAG: glycosyltransferase, partial [Candidatus Hinthialibacter sp.]